MTLPSEARTASVNQATAEFLVVCLCAEWCATCREYRSGFNDLAAEFPAANFRWLDIEERADDLGELDIENFPTLFIARRAAVLFFGTMPPQLGHLRRMLLSLSAQSPAESLAYARANSERRAWQAHPDISRLGDLFA